MVLCPHEQAFSSHSIPVTASLPPLEWPLSSQSGSYELRIEVQPKPHHRAHYETEGSRGAVKAPTGGHPVVQVWTQILFLLYPMIATRRFTLLADVCESEDTSAFYFSEREKPEMRVRSLLQSCIPGGSLQGRVRKHDVRGEDSPAFYL